MTADLDLLTDIEGGTVALGDIGEHPHGRDVGHRIGRRRIAGLHQKPGCRIARRDAAGRSDSARPGSGRPGARRRCVSISASVLPKMRTASRAARRLPSAVCWSETACSRSFCETARVSIELLEALQIAGGQLQHAGGRDQGRVGLQQVRAVDGEQGLALFHLVADLGEQPDDPSLIGREDLDRHFLVEVDAADRGLLDRKVVLSDRLDLDGRQLRVGQVDAIGRGRTPGSARGSRISLLGIGIPRSHCLIPNQAGRRNTRSRRRRRLSGPPPQGLRSRKNSACGRNPWLKDVAAVESSESCHHGHHTARGPL